MFANYFGTFATKAIFKNTTAHFLFQTSFVYKYKWEHYFKKYMICILIPLQP